jgi:hypothetical protein
MTSKPYPPFDEAALDALADYSMRPAPLCPWGCKSDDEALQAGVPRPAHAFERVRYVCPVCCRRFRGYMWWERDECNVYLRRLEFEPGWPLCPARRGDED